jgi:Prophage minor tail protein Z (GPZ)
MYIEVNDNINKIIQNVNADKAKVELATVRALNKTALWVRSQAIKQISKEEQIPQKLLKSRFYVNRANKNYMKSRISVGLFEIRASRLGNIKQTRIGAKAGRRMFKGAFVATMKSGYKGVFERMGRTPLPIEEVMVYKNTKTIVKKLINNEMEKVFERYFHQQLQYILK